MNTRADDALEDVLNAYVAAVPEPSHAALTEWVRRYPRYARELTEFTASWGLMETLPADPAITSIPDETLVLRGMSVVQQILHAQQSDVQEHTAASLPGVLASARARGLNLRAVADQADVSPLLVRKLDRRLIRFSSIPDELIARVARAIDASTAQLRQYLIGPPLLSQGARYKADQSPELAGPQDFIDAVRADTQLSDEQRAYWLSHAPADRG